MAKSQRPVGMDKLSSSAFKCGPNIALMYARVIQLVFIVSGLYYHKFPLKSILHWHIYDESSTKKQL